MNILIIIIIIIAIVIALLCAYYWFYRRSERMDGSYIGSAAKREIEARFLDIDVDAVRKILKGLNAKCNYKVTRLYRAVYALPNGYARIRVEPRNGKSCVVLTSKVYPKADISGQQSATKIAPIETEVVLSSKDTYEDARAFMKSLLREKAIAEQYREEWSIGDANCVVDIDWLPGLKPSLEVECDDEQNVRKIANQLGLDYDKAIFGSYANAYAHVYGFTIDVINNQISELKFDSVLHVMRPFVKNNFDYFEDVASKGDPMAKK